MQRWLIVCALVAPLAVQAASAATNATEQQRVAVDAKPVSTRSMPAHAHAQVQQTAGARHLSDEERAELRRQLQQFNRQYGKRS
jgi:hypothetical protein